MANTTIYVAQLTREMRSAVRQYQDFDAKWNRLNDELNDYLDRSGITDIVQRDKIKSKNLTLAGHMSAATWWREKANTLATVIQTELMLRAMEKET